MKKYVLFTSALLVTAGIVSLFFVPRNSNYYALTFKENLKTVDVEKELSKKYKIFSDFSHFSVFTFISHRSIEDVVEDIGHLGKIEILNLDRIKLFDYIRNMYKK